MKRKTAHLDIILIMEYSYDFIGDIHGYASRLTDLLGKLGYKQTGKGFAHPSRKAFFVGDYIDRGPEIPRTLEIVKAMIDNGDAVGLMGNHEYNAICFNAEKEGGGYLRRHSIKNMLQHYETLRQFKNEQKLYQSYLDWFQTLQLFFEVDSFRAVHACWDAESIATLKARLPDGRLDRFILKEAHLNGTELYHAMDITLKGKETQLPGNIFFTDKDGHHRTMIRTKWWEDPRHQTYQSISVEPLPNLPATPVEMQGKTDALYYGDGERPVFFGHYWLKDVPTLYRYNVCCLDYSVAKDGYLTAYRFDEELRLNPEKLVYV